MARGASGLRRKRPAGSACLSEATQLQYGRLCTRAIATSVAPSPERRRPAEVSEPSVTSQLPAVVGTPRFHGQTDHPSRYPQPLDDSERRSRVLDTDGASRASLPRPSLRPSSPRAFAATHPPLQGCEDRVYGRWRTAKASNTRRQHLQASLVACSHAQVHISQPRIELHPSACFPAYLRNGLLHGPRPQLYPPGAHAGVQVRPSQIQRSAAPLASS